MKKLTLIVLTIFTTALFSCTTSQGDSFGYVAPPPTEQQDGYSNEAGPLQQPGGVSAAIEAEQGNPDSSFVSVRE